MPSSSASATSEPSHSIGSIFSWGASSRDSCATERGRERALPYSSAGRRPNIAEARSCESDPCSPRLMKRTSSADAPRRSAAEAFERPRDLTCPRMAAAILAVSRWVWSDAEGAPPPRGHPQAARPLRGLRLLAITRERLGERWNRHEPHRHYERSAAWVVPQGHRYVPMGIPARNGRCWTTGKALAFCLWPSSITHFVPRADLWTCTQHPPCPNDHPRVARESALQKGCP